MTFTIILRSTIIYILVLFLLRIMGKRQIGQMQPYEFVITLIIADLATVPMSDTALPLLHGIIPLLTLVCLHFLFTFLEKKSIKLRQILNGKPVILMDPDGINYKNLKLCNMNFNDLQEALRSAGYFNLDEILYAIIQTNGTVSILPKAEFAPLTASSIDVSIEPASLPIIIVAEGKIIEENSKLAKIDKNIIMQHIKQIGFNSLKEVLIMTINTKGKIFIQKYNNQATTTQLQNYTGEW